MVAPFSCDVAYAQAGNVGTSTSATTESGGAPYDRFIAQALQAYEAGRFAEARTLFRRAHELAPTARTLRTIGMCAFNLGDYLDAMQNLDAALHEPRKPLTAEQREHVLDLMARSQARIGRFRVRVVPADATLSVDGRAPLRLTSGELIVEPGRHELTARAEGYRSSRSLLRVEGGDRATLELRLEPNPPPAADESAKVAMVEAPAAEPSVTAPTPDAPASTQSVLGYIALGVGAAGMVGFGVTTALAADKASTLDEACDGRACGPAYHDDVDSYDRYKLLSTVSLIGGLVFAGAGVALLLTQPEASSERAALSPVLGLGSLGVRGSL